MAKAAISAPSTSLCGSWRMISRSLDEPGSRSSGLITRKLGLPGLGSLGMKPHFMPVGKPAPPRPRSPDSLTAVMMSSGAMASAVLSASYPPLRSYVARFQLCSSAQSEVRTGVKVSAILVTLLQLGLGLGARGVGLLGGLGGRGGRACGLAGRLGARRAPAVLAGYAQPPQ